MDSRLLQNVEKLSPCQVAEITGRAVDTVYQWIHDGCLRATRVKGRWLILRVDVDRLEVPTTAHKCP